MAGTVHATRKYKFGISLSEYQALLEKQNGLCSGCGCGERMLGRGGAIRSLSVDHCHDSGRIRGLLCDACNNILGRAKDSPALLRRLAAYLEVADSGHKVKNLERANVNKHLSASVLRQSMPDADQLADELAQL